MIVALDLEREGEWKERAEECEIWGLAAKILQFPNLIRTSLSLSLPSLVTEKMLLWKLPIRINIQFVVGVVQRQGKFNTGRHSQYVGGRKRNRKGFLGEYLQMEFRVVLCQRRREEGERTSSGGVLK